MRSIRITYSIAIVVCVIAYVWTGSVYALALAGALAAFALLLLVGVIISRRSCRVLIQIPHAFEMNEGASAELVVSEALPLSLCLFSFEIECVSLTFNTVDTTLAIVPLDRRNHKYMSIPLDSSHYGRMQVHIKNCHCVDPLGLFKLDVDWQASGNCVVYPYSLRLSTTVENVPLARTFGKAYDVHRSGSDIDEVFDVHEFQPGDHLASVHWKLSSKFDVMMSREFSRPVDFEIVVVSFGSRTDETGKIVSSDEINGVAAVSLAISNDLLEQGLFHNYALPIADGLESVGVEGLDSRTLTEEMLLEAPLGEYQDAKASLMISELAENFTKAILVTAVYDEPLWTQLALELDLTVVLLSHETGHTQETDNYKLVALDTEGLVSREHNIFL